jgi:tetratricopeptide (TPR) repeat protein
MNDKFLPAIYLGVLIILLASTAVLILRQIIKTRSIESSFSRLQNKIKDGKGTAQDYYELGSLYLDKKLFVQSVSLFQRALKEAKEELEPENKALIYNALGYAYFAQEQYDLAIRNYKEAVKLYPQYIIAFNNLANVYEKKQMVAKAIETYEESLKQEPENAVAKKRIESLRKRLVTSQ